MRVARVVLLLLTVTTTAVVGQEEDPIADIVNASNATDGLTAEEIAAMGKCNSFEPQLYIIL